ncbi:hypothetical protein D3C87_11630 [compost metagenome]
MKRLLFITAIISSISGFSQEKGAQCESKCNLTYHHGTKTDLFQIRGFYFDLFECTEAFEQSTTDPKLYEVSINPGDSLIYNTDFIFEVCPGGIGADDLDSVLLVLEGDPVSLTQDWSVSSYHGDHFWQKGIIKSAGLFRFRDDYHNPENTYFVRVTMKELSNPEIPIPDDSDEIILSLLNENTLSVKSNDESAVLDLNLYSLSGQLIYHTMVEGGNTIDVSTLSKGYFIACVTDQNGVEKSLKFVR